MLHPQALFLYSDACFYTQSPDSMSKSFGQSFRIGKSHSILAMKVFCCWDFKVLKKTSVELMSDNIYIQLKVG